MDWLSVLLLSCAVAEALFLRWKRPQSVDLLSSGASFFIHFGRIWFVPLVLGFFRTYAFGAFVFANLVAVAWPYRLATVPMDAWWAWPVLFVAADFLYYWEHRFKHRVRWFWTTHAVHHSIRVMNLTEAYRLGWTGALGTGVAFYAPLVIAGFRPRDVFWMLMIQQVYQLFTHIDWIPKLGFIEKVLVTPSHHRVHHAMNDIYIDRNFGGVFSFFDRMFGTFVEEREDEQCRYGLITADGSPLETRNPFRILFHAWMEMFRGARSALRAKGVFAAIAYMFRPPHNEPELHAETLDQYERKPISRRRSA